MANYTAADVKRLRELTAAGMMDCKRALEESDGDFDKAVEVLRLKGAKDVGKREARTASNGLVAAALDGTAAGALLELACETDFVAKSERFQQLAAEVTQRVLTGAPEDAEQLNGFEVTGGQTVKQALDEANVALGEKIEVRRFARFDDGYVATYLHKSSPDLPPTVGVLVELTGHEAEVAKSVAQHIAAMAPKYLTRDDVPAETVDAERRIAEQMARDEGKPEAALPKIIEGRVNAFYKDFCLLEQAYVKDNKQTVKAVLDAAGVGVTRFARFKVGRS